MDMVIAGAHGKIAMLLHPLLLERGHRVRGLIRNPDHASDLEALGVKPVFCDLEAEDDLSTHVGKADVVVFAAGAGPGSGTERKWSMDRDGAIKLIQAAHANGIDRYVMISAMDLRTPRGSEVFQAYLQAKLEADEALERSGLAYTIVRPGRLTDDPGTGHVAMAPALPKGQIPRADVAAVLAEVLESPSTSGLQFDVTEGPEPIGSALVGLERFK